ncbi:MAG: hypothetical protein JWQ78_1937, partial [Sediminibacterium sp.]|nr:hypothetical protein [Sediminibacterium sp.]
MKYIFTLLFISVLNFAHAQMKPLFNGKDINNWTINGTEIWYVSDGELICESGPDKQYGYLSTKKAYKNFVLSLEFKQEANGNSG